MRSTVIVIHSFLHYFPSMSRSILDLGYTPRSHILQSPSRSLELHTVSSSLYVADSSPLLETEIPQLYLRYGPSKLLVHLL